MSDNVLLASYPNAPQVVAFVEMILCVPPQGESRSSWELMMGARFGPSDVINTVRELLAAELVDGTIQVRPDILRAAIAQVDTPDFRRYVAGKMGAM